MTPAVSRETVNRDPREHGSPESPSCADQPSAAIAVSRETGSHPSPLARLILLPIRGYRRFLSPALGARCRYYPSCSAYAEESVRDLGAIRGSILAVWRVMRCNPLSNGGLDPVSDRGLFRDAERTHSRPEADPA